ncbi:MAG TPA: lysophospholipid acyltransferase family protein [Candidatus Avacidaminococcus intestinavium]|uniref:Lysophospholipid acyltransferase family protein n=1 Tax=Candidatus Avacidaminococcus intestinavium TaxID=2840684 RepID=A0A9D1MP21_9FIRM|nr:lysophospholipid acyltransferase family protein [Candidatus Avacidaminococcus intestinavium]
MLGYWFMKALSWILCHSPKFLVKLIADGIGFLAWQVTPAWRKRMAIVNIKECLGVETPRAEIIAHASVKRFGRMLTEVLRFPVLDKTFLQEHIEVEGREFLEAAYQQKKGVILCTGHFGNWELLGMSVALMGYPLLSIARKQNNSAMDNFINEYRSLGGQQIVYNRGESSMLTISRVLRDKKMLGVLYDQDTADDSMELEFFGKKTKVPLGAAFFSRLHGAPIVPFFLHNNGEDKFVLRIYPPLYAEKTKDRATDLQKPMKELMLILEHEIIKNPSMWFWLHDRWKDGKRRFRDTESEG